MSDTNDLRERLCMEIGAAITRSGRTSHFTDAMITGEADALIAVATPIIRAQVIEELAQKAEREASGMGHPNRTLWFDRAEWLRAQQEDPGDKKIYIKG